MSSLREIRDRIDSVRSTLKITNAMYMISSTKLNNAKRSLAATEPFFYGLQGLFQRIIRHVPPGFEHPFLEQRVTENQTGEGSRRAVICVTADKGLAGAYNHNVEKLTEELLRPDSNDKLYVVGEFGRHYFESRKIAIDGQIHYTAQNPTYSRAREIASVMLDLFRKKEVDEVFIVYTRMRNSMEFIPESRQLLPLIRLDNNLFRMAGQAQNEAFIMDPDPGTLLDNIIPDFVAGYIYSALVESFASEQSSRMQAMDAANKAGQKLVQELTVQYNRERQAQITQEITEVAAGARARREQQRKARERMQRQKSAAAGVSPQ